MAQTWTGDGTGTETDPYQIRTAEELNAVRYFLTAHFRLMNDIDLTEWLNAHEGDKGWNPIGVNTMAGAFQGTFHGGGHTISGLWIERPAMDEVGLFGVIHDDFSIDSLTIRIADNKRIAGHDYVGGLAGMIESDTFSDAIKYISNISVFGNVYGNTRVGGLIGYCAWREIYVCNSYFMGSVSGTMYCVGGLIGEYYVLKGHVMDCYAVGKVTGNGAVGGLIGINFLGYIERCYSASMVKGDEHVGGLMGANVHGILKGGEGDKIKDCYSFSKVKGHCYTGGLVGQNDAANIINSYSYGTVVGDDRTGGIMGGDTTETQWTSSMKNCVAMQYHILGSTNTGRVSGINTITIPENCYAFDQMEIVPQGNHYVHGEDRTLQQLQQQNSYTDIHWLFGDNQNNPWNIWEEISFPYLYYQSAPVIIKSANTKQISGILRNPTDSVLLFLFIDDAYILAGKADITGLQWKANISVDIDARDTLFVLSFENKKSCSYPVSALFIMGEVTDVEVYPKEITLAVGEITTLQATVIPETAMNHRVIWTTHNPAIADVDDNGNVMAIAIGSTYIVATTEDGNKKDSCLVHVIATNIENIVFDNRIVVFPNPTDGQLRIMNYESRITGIEIFDLLGRLCHVETRLIASLQSSYTTILDISHLPTGMYFLRITTDKGIVTKKVIKMSEL
jgi:uncharacterized protein YjdB